MSAAMKFHFSLYSEFGSKILCQQKKNCNMQINKRNQKISSRINKNLVDARENLRDTVLFYMKFNLDILKNLDRLKRIEYKNVLKEARGE